MELSLFGGALALSRYVPATNVARATRSVLSLVSSERVEVGGAQQAKRRATASNETHWLIVLALSQSAPFSAPDASPLVLRGPGSRGR